MKTNFLAAIALGCFLLSDYSTAASLPLLVVSSGTNSIQKFDSGTDASLGAFVSNTLVGSGPEGQTPSAIAQGPDGNVYVGYWGGPMNLTFPENNGGILEYSPTGTLLNNLNVGASVTGIAFAPNGDLYISKVSSGAGSVDQITAVGSNPIAVDTPLKTGLGTTLRGIGVIPNGASYLIGYGTTSTSLHTINPDGSTGTTYAPGLLDNSDQVGIGVRSDGTVFVSEQATNRVFTVTPTSATLFASSASDTTQSLNNPGRFAFDSAGNVYFGNVNKDAVTKYGPTGTFISEIVPVSAGLKTPQDEILFVSPVPEPASIVLGLVSMTGLGVCALQRRFSR